MVEDDVQPGIRLGPGLPIAVQVRDILERRILGNALPPGTLLSENELSASLQVSRQPVREALIRLSEAQLVRALPQRGTEVTRISVSAVQSGQFVREAVECAIAREAALRAGDADLADLAELITAQEKAAQAENQARFLALDDALHHRLAVVAGHQPAWRTLRTIKLQMDRVRYLSLGDATPVPLLVEQHAAILRALRARDPDSAERAMRTHLAELLRSLPQLLERLPFYFDPH